MTKNVGTPNGTDDLVPKFLGEFNTAEDVAEEDGVDFRCPIWPEGEEAVQADWFQNDKPVVIGSRCEPYLEDGIVGLCIDPVYERDSGIYTCVIKNQYGTAKQTTKLTCKDKSKKISSAPFRRSSVQPTDLQAAKRDSLSSSSKTSSPSKDDNGDKVDEIVILRPLAPEYTVDENENITIEMEIDIQDVTNADWDVEWFHNGHALLMSNRIKPLFEYGILGLKLEKINSNDIGEYVVNVYDKSTSPRKLLGHYETYLKVKIEENISRDPINAASLHQIRKLEAWASPSTRYASLYPNRADIIRELIKRRKSAKS